MTQETNAASGGIWGSVPVEEPKAEPKDEMSTTTDAPQSEISDKNQENKPNCGILEPSGPTTKTIGNKAGQPSMSVTEFDFDAMSHKGEPRDMLCAGSFTCNDLEKKLEHGLRLARLSFPSAPSCIVDAIGYTLHAQGLMIWVRSLKAHWDSTPNPRVDSEELIDAAIDAFLNAKKAHKLAFSVFKHSNPAWGAAMGLATADGLLVGTSNAPADLSSDADILLNTTAAYRKGLVCRLPSLGQALVEPECSGGSTLPVEGATALSVEGWADFCKQLDVLVFACTKTLIEALKATAPHYPEPLEG